MNPLLPTAILATLPARHDQILLSPFVGRFLPDNLLEADLTVRTCIDELVAEGLAYRTGSWVRHLEAV